MRKILAGGSLSCHSSGPPLLAGLKTATVMDKYTLAWGFKPLWFSCLHRGILAWENLPQTCQVSAQNTSTGMQRSLCSDHLINYQGKFDVPKPSQVILVDVRHKNLHLFTTSLAWISRGLRSTTVYTPTVVAIFVVFIEVSRDSGKNRIALSSGFPCSHVNWLVS